jgi:hypothetical protein
MESGSVTVALLQWTYVKINRVSYNRDLIEIEHGTWLSNTIIMNN